MTIRVGITTQIERNPWDLAGMAPAVSYLMDSGVAGIYLLGSGNKAAEATAFLKDAGSSVYTLDDDVSEEDRIPYLIETPLVTI